jgi:hypothetical protein
VAWSQRPSPEEELANEAALRHARRLPLEVQSPTAASLETWFDGKLNHPVRLPRLLNVTPAGGRLSHLSDHEAAYVTYTTAPGTSGEARRVGLFVLEGQPVPTSDLEVKPSHGYNVATWQGDGLTYELVTDMGEAEIRQMLDRPSNPVFQPASFTSH